jgi:hypothetical protein
MAIKESKLKPKLIKFLRLLFVAIVQIGFVFGLFTAGASGFKLPFSIPFGLSIVIWLGAPIIAAAIANYSIISKAPSFPSRINAAILAIFLSYVSFSLAMVLSLNTYGS